MILWNTRAGPGAPIALTGSAWLLANIKSTCWYLYTQTTVITQITHDIQIQYSRVPTAQYSAHTVYLPLTSPLCIFYNMFCCKMKATSKYPVLLSDWYNKPSPLPREWLGKSHIHSFGIVRIGKLFLLMSFLGCLAPLPPPPYSPSHSSTNTHSPSSTSITSHFTFTPVSKRSVVNRDY